MSYYFWLVHCHNLTFQTPLSNLYKRILTCLLLQHRKELNCKAANAEVSINIMAHLYKFPPKLPHFFKTLRVTMILCQRKSCKMMPYTGR